MTDLQISLIAVGGAFIVAVFAFNKWQEYKARKSVERAFAGEPDDVLMRPSSKRQEPNLQDPNLQDDDDDDDADTRHAPVARGDDGSTMSIAPQATEPRVGSASAPKSTPSAPAVPPYAAGLPPSSSHYKQDPSPIDTLIDCVMPMMPDTPIRGDKLLPVLQKLRHVGNRAVHYAGSNAGSSSDSAGEWGAISHGGVYSALRVGVQMASRHSAINELEYSELVMRLRQLADELGAEVDVLDMHDVITRARSLHQFVVDHDAQLGVNIHSNSAPWAINTLLLALEKQGFDLRPDGRFVMPDGEGGHLFSLSTNVTPAADITSRLTLLLDVPCVSPEKDGFGAMIACAQSLVKRLDGTIVDDSNTPLSAEALAQIGGQVLAFYEEMQTCQIIAGSPRALRLFS